MSERTIGCVYFFRHLGLNPVKIGYSTEKSPISRFSSFKTYAPFGAELLGIIPTKFPVQIEKRLHKKYESKRLTGEWFDISIEDVEFEIKDNTSFEVLRERSMFWEEYIRRNDVISEYSIPIEGEFLDFIRDFLQDSISIARAELKHRYCKTITFEVTPQEFYKKVREYCKMNNILLREKKVNGIFNFFFDID